MCFFERFYFHWLFPWVGYKCVFLVFDDANLLVTQASGIGSCLDLLVEKWFVPKAVDSFRDKESCEYSSVVEVSVFLVVIKLVFVDVVGYVFGDFDGVINIGRRVSVLD